MMQSSYKITFCQVACRSYVAVCGVIDSCLAVGPIPIVVVVAACRYVVFSRRRLPVRPRSDDRIRWGRYGNTTMYRFSRLIL